MISYAAALDIIARTVRPLAPRRVATAQALGMSAAEDIHSATALPSFANAAMDGYALRSADVAAASTAAPVELVIAGSIVAGEPPPAENLPQRAWEITTGAPMPRDCDAVLPIERAQLGTTAAGAPCLRVGEPVAADANRREAGSDFALGDRVVAAGTRLDARALMALAATGIDEVSARPLPRFALLVTGSELAERGLPDASSRIRDANGPYLRASLAELGLPEGGLRRVRDDAAQVARDIAELAATSDVVLTTGGVSAGRLDFMPAAVRALGGEILFHKVAIRPGKPLLMARLPGDTLLFGLPGNPMAVAVGLRFFVLPALRALLAMAPERRLAARCEAPVRKRRGLTFFAKAHAAVDAAARLQVTVLPGQESFRIAPLLEANCWAIVPEGREAVAAGDIIEIAPLLPLMP